MNPIETAQFDDLIGMALELGAKAAAVIHSGAVVIDERVIMKCQVPRCPSFNHYLACPPHTISVPDFTRILSRYRWCLILQIEAACDSSDKTDRRISAVRQTENDLHKPYKLKLLSIIEDLEAAAFKKGLRFAAGLTGGHCVLCDRCVDFKGGEECKFPYRARPSMEGVGIDVFQTAMNAGFPIHLSSSEKVLWTGLILLD